MNEDSCILEPEVSIEDKLGMLIARGLVTYYIDANLNFEREQWTREPQNGNESWRFVTH